MKRLLPGFPRLLGVLIFAALATYLTAKESPVPFVKHWTPGSGEVMLTSASLVLTSPALAGERETAVALLGASGVAIEDSRLPVHMEIAPVKVPTAETSTPRDPEHLARIRKEAYRLAIAPEGIRIQGATPAAVFYGLQTLSQMLGPDRRLACGELYDWPDLPVRMLMVDPARQNENFDYYRRVIDFAARWKINSLLIHLTDDQTACLYHPEYPELMHLQAWTPEQAQKLRAYAAQRHIQLIPEIESFGHSQMFVRRPNYTEILHKTDAERTVFWMGTDIPGYTNVLCPASEKTYEYLDKMYAQAREAFGNSVLHIGFDEVDMTTCERCEAAFPGITKSQWFLKHLLRAREIALNHFDSVALWGDMLLKYPDILDQLPTERTIIYDWYYVPDVIAESSRLFKRKGFTVMACPALVCSPHMIRPDEDAYTNIRKFTAIARDNDLLGVNTTIWIPTRYMSDVLWPGIAYAAAEAWGGETLAGDDTAALALFFRDFFDAPSSGERFADTWNRLSKVHWRRNDFNPGWWIDEKSLDEAATLARENEAGIRTKQKQVREVLRDLQRLGKEVKLNREAWDTILHSVALLDLTMEHALAAGEIRTEKGLNRKRLAELDADTRQAIQWIEADWDRNRYPDDPNKDGIHMAYQHILYRLKQAHEFHQKLLSGSTSSSATPAE